MDVSSGACNSQGEKENEKYGLRETLTASDTHTTAGLFSEQQTRGASPSLGSVRKKGSSLLLGLSLPDDR